MAKRVTNKTEKSEGESLAVAQQLEGLRQEVQVAIEAITNVPYKLLSAAEGCTAMKISPHTLLRYERLFAIPVHKIGRKKFYFEVEVKNSIVTGLRFWKL